MKWSALTRTAARRKTGGGKNAELWSIWPPIIIDSKQLRKKMKEKMKEKKK